ncbi:hypothetical protein DRN72_01420 [Methanosarcinales archaeon]|nr:MAG: hypothetical protein DRN72_01420 [Methanosarcinales archaeon]
MEGFADAILKVVYEYVEQGDAEELCSRICSFIGITAEDPISVVNAVGEAVVDHDLAKGFESMELTDGAISLNFWGCESDLKGVDVVLVCALLSKVGEVYEVAETISDNQHQYLLRPHPST